MPTTICTINLKGGVGKTQTTVALAEYLVLENSAIGLETRPKVLVIDLDPQTNATIMLMDEQLWHSKNISSLTLNALFKDALLETDCFDICNAIHRNASNIDGGINGLDLLPSSLDLIDLQDKLHNIDSPNTVLYRSLKEANLLQNYDYIIIDCPPNLGIITKNGLYFSDYYIIPTIPDILSTYGIPQIMTSIGKFRSPKWDDPPVGKLTPLGILVSKYRVQNPLHRSKAQELDASPIPPRTFATRIREATDISKAAMFDSDAKYANLKSKYTSLYTDYLNFAREVVDRAK